MGQKFTKCFHVPGTLSANLAIVFTADRDFTITHISAVASNDSDATLKAGTTTDDDAYLTATAIGDSSVPVEFDKDDFIGTEYPRVQDGDVVKLTLDYDGDGGTAANDVTIVVSCREG